ncbi:MAG: MucR family transcriptional regulator [Arachnia propionica]|uniref:MucR family transcriptional regulator n=1 Tax=Arachnia propionica TaxID=1750 RepID=UPI00270A3528|nr:MucR family transcriptional regulator [Arachnia propionica]
MELPEQDGRVQCLECGRWFRSLIGHISRIHGMTAEEYRAAHGLARTTALVASSVSEQLHAHGIRRRDADPRVLEALSGDGARRQRAAAFPRAREPRRPATRRATRAAKRQQGELRLQAALDAAGWGSLAEAVEWARGEGLGWAAISTRLQGWSITSLKNRAVRDGIPPLGRMMPVTARAMLDQARRHVAEHGDLSQVGGELSRFLVKHRWFAQHDQPTPVTRALDQIDPTWSQPRR